MARTSGRGHLPSELQRWPEQSADGSHLGPDISTHGEQQYDYSEACNMLDLTGLLAECYANPPDLEDQILYPSISETGPPCLPVPVASNNPQIILDRQRRQPQPRDKTGFICRFRGDKCPFMAIKDNRVFKNVAELKEDALRHLNPFQCKKCGQRFGKRYGLGRHSKGKTPCMQRPVKKGARVQISQELEGAVIALEEAKGYDEVIVAIDVCKEFYDPIEADSRIEIRETRRRLPRRSNSVTTNQTNAVISTDTSPGNGAWSPQTSLQDSAALGSTQDLLAYTTTPQQLSGSQESGGATCNSAGDDIYNETSGEMELNPMLFSSSLELYGYSTYGPGAYGHDQGAVQHYYQRID